LIKNSQPFGKKLQKTVGGGIFFDSHCITTTTTATTTATTTIHITGSFTTARHISLTVILLFECCFVTAIDCIHFLSSCILSVHVCLQLQSDSCSIKETFDYCYYYSHDYNCNYSHYYNDEWQLWM